jgi:hypothetical protein
LTFTVYCVGFGNAYLSDNLTILELQGERESLTTEHPRIKREKKTIEAMVQIYCKNHHEHRGGELCEECSSFFEYAKMRLDKCPFQEKKTTCGKCPIHCYQPQMREKVKKVMRYSGPRMLLHHPGLAIHHAIDGLKKPKKKAAQKK